jgi:hypothetical protein
MQVDFKRQLVGLANANNERMDGTMGPVLKIIAAHDLVFAVWQDCKAADGVGTLVIKGANLLRDIVSIGTGIGAQTTAIKCICAEQAEALRLHVRSRSSLDQLH